MRIFSRKTLKEYWEDHEDIEQPLRTWYSDVSKAEWKTPNDIKEKYPKASFLKNSRVVFDIKGNTYRLVVRVNFPRLWVFIRFIGTHAEYDKIDANEV